MAIWCWCGDSGTALLDELCMFPNATHDDQVDALSGAFGRFSMEQGQWSTVRAAGHI
jgi:phage terminase large subunit-like protein